VARQDTFVQVPLHSEALIGMLNFVAECPGWAVYLVLEQSDHAEGEALELRLRQRVLVLLGADADGRVTVRRVCDPEPAAQWAPVVPEAAIEDTVNSDRYRDRVVKLLRPVPPDVDQVRHRLALSANRWQG
jgi:hypothetical protein